MPCVRGAVLELGGHSRPLPSGPRTSPESWQVDSCNLSDPKQRSDVIRSRCHHTVSTGSAPHVWDQRGTQKGIMEQRRGTAGWPRPRQSKSEGHTRDGGQKDAVTTGQDNETPLNVPLRPQLEKLRSRTEPRGETDKPTAPRSCRLTGVGGTGRPSEKVRGPPRQPQQLPSAHQAAATGPHLGPPGSTDIKPIPLSVQQLKTHRRFPTTTDSTWKSGTGSCLEIQLFAN